MAEIGQAPRSLVAARLWGAAALVATVLPALWLWGFTVDDALIAVRYARHLAAGFGYRFNAHGPITDGVTPLPWAFLLAPLARAAPLVVLRRAKVLGLLVGGAAAWPLGVTVGQAPASRAAKLAGLAVLAASVPVAAHTVSGMETALAMALATLAVTASARPARTAVLAGLATSLRPELLPWALVLAVGLELSQGGRPLPVARAVALAGAPFAVCVVVRLLVFGRPVPLAVLAKPSDVLHGVAYAGAAGLAALTPILAAAPVTLARGPRRALVVAAAGLTHLLAVAAAGGDWMPFARLVAPIAPSLLLVFVWTAPHAPLWATRLRVALALGLGVYLAATVGPGARHVGADRARLVAAARPALEDARRVASVDVGWPTAATEADIVDLAGLTDPEIAALPGGHTSKRVDAAMLLARDADVLLLYTPAGGDPGDPSRVVRFPRVVEARLAASPLIADHYAPRAFLPLGDAGAGYVLMARVVDPSAGVR